MASINKILRGLLCFPIKIYQYLMSPLLANNCKYYPSCSNYALKAIQQLGIIKGGWKTISRLLRCNPWVKGGYDPVFPNDESN